MNQENYKKYAAKYKRTELGSSGEVDWNKPNKGCSRWVESGIVIEARTVRTGLKHAWENGGYNAGIRDCPCGGFMCSSTSGGPTDPDGDCPYDERQTAAEPTEHITCPCCQASYSEYDAASEYVRVLKFISDNREALRNRAMLEQVESKLREVCEWLRCGSPGKALEAAERKI